MIDYTTVPFWLQFDQSFLKRVWPLVAITVMTGFLVTGSQRAHYSVNEGKEDVYSILFCFCTKLHCFVACEVKQVVEFAWQTCGQREFEDSKC